MTRINVGIHPDELCDQHLLAEYRELPRGIGHVPKVAVEGPFRLNGGHVNWCARFQASLMMRQNIIVAELKRRGFKPSFDALLTPEPQHLSWSSLDNASARPLLIERINARLSGMRRAKWTNVVRPLWAAGRLC